jgi:FkbM family methyltransferase
VRPPAGRRLAGRLGWTGLRALNRAGWLTREGASVELELHGRAVTVPLWGGIGLDHSAVPDPHLLAVLRALLRLREGAFADVGAHVGQTLVKLLVIGDPRAYVGFEPKPRAAAYVQALLRANGRPRDAVLAAAAGESARVASLALAGELDDGAALVDAGTEGTVPVAVVRGDDALAAAGIRALGLLKVDAEGAELGVLRGFRAALERDRPPVLCEILPFGPAGAQAEGRRARAKELFDLLGGLGYAALLCDQGGRARRVERAADARGFAERDYAFVQEDDLARIPELIAA